LDLKRKSNTQKKHCKSSAFLYPYHNKKDDLIFSVQFSLIQLLYLLKEIQFLNFMYFFSVGNFIVPRKTCYNARRSHDNDE